MTANPERELRDRQTTAWHEQALASGQKRYLRRAYNGELVSYLPEEYGVGRNGLGPKIHTVWGHAVLVVCEIIALVAVFSAFQFGGGELSGGVLFAFGFFLLVTAYSAWNLIKEAKATILRRQRGLPTPAE
ncbi:hypothetical protein [Mycetocola zhadangensis]|uniref:Uncharacterized protein n=1 Tax=Mycetocola zhadangensis TaxID=1164595 RepID=A0A3L7J1E6_9MICO|nr:hypothetical protein [Mycetocola zhadangensis]RLQ84209.1 hypothetical protein D9V28_08300 [Mycetocola zhadangensis]GGE95159.1 hypothetical protein GCM10011313_17640 [Mycetocola zhadangensis]